MNLFIYFPYSADISHCNILFCYPQKKNLSKNTFCNCGKIKEKITTGKHVWTNALLWKKRILWKKCKYETKWLEYFWKLSFSLGNLFVHKMLYFIAFDMSAFTGVSCVRNKKCLEHSSYIYVLYGIFSKWQMHK